MQEWLAGLPMLVHGFAPVVGWNARVLILGTLPGGDSLRFHQYYANTRNAFWFIMRQLFNIIGSYDERLESLIKNRIAIWDVLQRAERSGSLDGAIVRGTEVPNDFPHSSALIRLSKTSSSTAARQSNCIGILSFLGSSWALKYRDPGYSHRQAQPIRTLRRRQRLRVGSSCEQR